LTTAGTVHEQNNTEKLDDGDGSYTARTSRKPETASGTITRSGKSSSSPWPSSTATALGELLARKREQLRLPEDKRHTHGIQKNEETKVDGHDADDVVQHADEKERTK
jgi:hypothetical protein